MPIGQTIYGTYGNDELTGTADDDTLIGFDGDDRLRGEGGDDVLSGGYGNDHYYIAQAGDLIIEDQWAGDDTVVSEISFSLENQWLENLHLTGYGLTGTGNQLNNIIVGYEGDNALYGLDGDDFLSGNAGKDKLFGGYGNDILAGGVGGDVLNGGAGLDTAYYREAAGAVTVSLALPNTLQNTGGDGWDRLISIENLVGSGFDDHLTGNDGANVIEGGAGQDVIDGGAGRDTASFQWAGYSVNVDLSLASPHASGYGSGEDTLISIENLFGSDAHDYLGGNGIANVLDGYLGDDVISAGGGNDTIIGGFGADILTGGAGADRFIFREGETSNVKEYADRIEDFRQIQHDRIDLSRIDADRNSDGDQGFTFVGDAEFSNTAGELRFVRTDYDTMISADVDGDGVADLYIQLSNPVTLTAADFIL